LDFSATGGKKQRHGSALIGAGVTGRTVPGLETPNPIAVFHLVRLAKIIGSITNHAENAGDMRRALNTE